MNIAGKFYSKNITTGSEVVGQDLFDTIKADLSDVSPVIAKQLTLVSSSSLSVDVNNAGVYYPLSDYSGSYLLSIENADIYVRSLKVKESGRNVFISIIY